MGISGHFWPKETWCGVHPGLIATAEEQIFFTTAVMVFRLKSAKILRALYILHPELTRLRPRRSGEPA